MFSVSGQFGQLGMLLVVAFIFAVTMPLTAYTFMKLGLVKPRPSAEKSTTYECGMDTVGSSWVQFNFRYYLYAILFTAIDVMAVFLYLWAVCFKGLGAVGFIAVAVFIVFLGVGYLYAWNKKVLEWK